jgi:ketosteroid isomerase-like protein
MKRQRFQAATLGGTPDEVEQAFYEALQHADIDQLMACWAEEDEVVCIHPGGQRLIGQGAIRSAFEALFAQGALQVRPERIHKIDALASAVHHLIENVSLLTPQGVQSAWVTVTNVYHKTPHGWRMVAHHASPGAAQDPSDAVHSPAVLH